MLTIVRHCESVENAEKYTGFYKDPRPYSGEEAHILSRETVGLTPRGFRQARWLNTVLSTLPSPLVVYSSTYRRAKESALAAVGNLPDVIYETALLDEQHYGDATYMLKDELFRTYPDTEHDRQTRKHIWVPPGGGESVVDIREKRAVPFVAMAERHVGAGASVIAFTHHTTIMALRSVLERRDLEGVVAETKARKVPNAAVLQYALDSGRFEHAGTVIPPESL